MKVRIHFNRVNMQRKLETVWSAHTSKSCNPAAKVVVRHKGRVILETFYSPEGKQPRACLVAHGDVSFEGSTAVVNVP